MNAFRPPSPSPDFDANGAPVPDPRLQPTPDYGTLGPGSDVIAEGLAPASGGPIPSANSKKPFTRPQIAIIVGVMLAFFIGNIVSLHAYWSRVTRISSSQGRAGHSGTSNAIGPLDSMRPQKEAEALLEQAVAHSGSAVDQISLRADRWQGKLQWDSQMATLTTAALNSSDLRVRQSGIEVELAAYGLGKNRASLDYVLRTVKSSNHAQKVWALWALGLLGNRGVETNRVVEVLTGHLKDPDEDSRRYAVEGLALVGGTDTIAPLLQAMHDDVAPSVRERAACSLAQSGMFTPEQRMSAVPQLLAYTDAPELDARTHQWAFQALSEITHLRLPNDPSAWRNWYESR
jgi:hypothetical protein